jgi:protein-arginine kinase activator protein McsA
MSTCSKHKKPRNVIFNQKMKNGAVFPFVLCEDCAKERSLPGWKKPVAKKTAAKGRRY